MISQNQMKKIFIFAMFVLVFGVPSLSLAAEFRSGNQPTVQPNEKITNDLYIAGGIVMSSGNITGDLITGGGTVFVNGNIGADVLAGGGNVSILGNVGDDVRVGGGTVVIGGKVGGDVIAGGGQISVTGPGVAGDVILGGGSISIDAPIGGKLTAGGKNVYINTRVVGNVEIDAESVTLGSSAVILGNLTYKSPHELVKETGAVINGKISFEPRAERSISRPEFFKIFYAFALGKFLILLFCALVFGLIFRRYNREIIIMTKKRPFSKLGWGFVVLFIMPIASILLLITLIGIPFGVIGLLGFTALMLFAWIVTPIVVGSIAYEYLSKKDSEISFWTILFGTVICSVLSIVPFFGPLLLCLLLLAVLGSIVAIKIRIIKEWR
ncbi:polymer-forming cytoskeletal protein [Candidatus Nomurabacteria bacterium]|nr:polymer-forming cytoskeletal protein [Candidatus Nomurabacteria bacterium]